MQGALLRPRSPPRTCTWVQIDNSGKTQKFSTSSPHLIQSCRYAQENNLFPFLTIIQEKPQGRYTTYQFT